MFIHETVIWKIFIIFPSLFLKRVNCAVTEEQIAQGAVIAKETANAFMGLYNDCIMTAMPNQLFLVDDLPRYLFQPAKTTVGVAPKFTSNRKFFANMLATPAFQAMLAKDKEEMRQNKIKKLKYCDKAVMDQKLLKEFYDREVDQSKM